MIVKSLSRKSNTSQLITYIFRYIFNQEKNLSNTEKELAFNNQSKFIIRHNIRSRSISGFIKEYRENESYRLICRKDSVKLFHTILSFSNKDKEHINDKLLKDIAKKFIVERGINNLYIGTKHEDKDHLHLHIAISGTQLNGRSSRISKQQFKHIKLTLDKYQKEKYPALVNSLPEHGKSKQVSKELLLQKLKAERQTNKQSLLECLEKTYTNSKSKEHFLSQLKELGHVPYYRNGNFQGVKFEGRKFRINRLGFDETRWQALGQTHAPDKALTELQELRSGKRKEVKRNNDSLIPEKVALNTSNKDEQKMLEEIAIVRGHAENEENDRADNDNGSRSLENDDELIPVPGTVTRLINPITLEQQLQG